jgi:hypothetical protein
MARCGTVAGIMPIALVADSPEELPEALRATAKEQGGKWHVAALPADYGIEYVKGVQTLKTRLTEKEQERRLALEEAMPWRVFPKDTDPAEVLKAGMFARGRVVFDVRADATGTPLVQTRGWTRATSLSLWDAVAGFAAVGLLHVLCTDVDRDGAMGGPAVGLYADAVRRFPAIRWQASGGVRDAAAQLARRWCGVGGAGAQAGAGGNGGTAGDFTAGTAGSAGTGEGGNGTNGGSASGGGGAALGGGGGGAGGGASGEYLIAQNKFLA